MFRNRERREKREYKSPARYLYLITVLIFLFVNYCQVKNSEKAEVSESPKHEIFNDSNQTSKSDNKTVREFDNSLIPEDVVSFALSQNGSYRLPNVNDYPEYNFDGYSNDNDLPYYCNGYFNNDTIRDHALLLLKDSTELLVLSMHLMDNVFITYELKRAPLIFDSENKKCFVSHIIETEREKVLEAIDTTYHLTTDALIISDMEESRTRVMVWNKEANRYDDLVFD